MRYLIPGTMSDGKTIVAYDANGKLCEVQVMDMPSDEAREWVFRHIPLEESRLKEWVKIKNMKVTVLNVTFDEFWNAYAYKEGKKDAQRAWDRLSVANRQLAYDGIQKYQARCRMDRKHLMYPATYLRAERWLDQL